MTRRAIFRARDIKKSIAEIRALLADRSLEDVIGDSIAVAAFERFLEILSEAARHLPEEWLDEHPAIPWRNIASLGNRIRHEYFRVDTAGPWAIYERDLDPLEAAIDSMLSAHSK